MALQRYLWITHSDCTRICEEAANRLTMEPAVDFASRGDHRRLASDYQGIRELRQRVCQEKPHRSQAEESSASSWPNQGKYFASLKFEPRWHKWSFNACRNNLKMKSRLKSRRTPSSKATSKDWSASFWKTLGSMWEASISGSKTPSLAGATKPSTLGSLLTLSLTQWQTTGLWGPSSTLTIRSKSKDHSRC